MPEITSPLPRSPSGPALGQGHARLPGPESGWQKPSGDSVFTKGMCSQRAGGGLLHTGHTRAWLEAHLIPAPSPSPENRLCEPTGPPDRVGPAARGRGQAGGCQPASAGRGRAAPRLPPREATLTGGQHGRLAHAHQGPSSNLVPSPRTRSRDLHKGPASAPAPGPELTSTASRV